MGKNEEMLNDILLFLDIFFKRTFQFCVSFDLMKIGMENKNNSHFTNEEIVRGSQSHMSCK